VQCISPNLIHFLAIVFVEEVVEFMIDIVEGQRQTCIKRLTHTILPCNVIATEYFIPTVISTGVESAVI
jgi:hypothetical protein